MKVLVADKDSNTRNTLKNKLKKWGYEVVEAADGKEAWRELNIVDPPRIAILEWVMAGMDGVIICRKLQDREEGPFVYTILLTDKSSQEDMVYALENGAHNFQSKPFSPEELRSYVNVGKRLVEADNKLSEYAAQMERLATTDSLTGIYSRRYFLERGEKELLRAQRYARPLSVLLMDVDRFKRINDTYGHSIGDEALKAMAYACLGGLRNSDVFGRLGGEEFAALLPETDSDTAFEVAERLRRIVAEMAVPAEGESVRITASIGVATFRPGDATIDNLLKRADEGLYSAKDAGRNQVSR